jgi:hypothetical protein
MKILSALLVTLTVFSSIHAFAQEQDAASAIPFLSELPDQMTCDASYFQAITVTTSPIGGGVKISLEGKTTIAPIVEVFAPKLTDKQFQHFKIGGGYLANLTQGDQDFFGYLSLKNPNSFAYLRVSIPGHKLTMSDYMNQRTQGTLAGFSARSVLLPGYRRIDLTNCIAAQ